MRVLMNTWLFEENVLLPYSNIAKDSMYDIFTYFWLIVYGKCMQIDHTLSVWDSNIARDTVDGRNPAPPDVFIEPCK